ncbi:MAG: pyridoxal phosphate-dependent aminotransferase [Kiritimatiellae bacterium]|nr:pyridoxal phosphate-dependent aminotransferase [Kiritimatiellia bacterium]
MKIITDEIATSISSGSWIRKMFEKGRELKDKFGEDAVCDFSLGNPDVPPPAAAKAALERIAENAVKPLGLGYCPNAGIPAVRAAMAEYLSKQQQTQVDASHVIMSVGAAGAMVSFFRAVIEPGDEVLVSAPYFVEYGFYCGHFGGTLKSVKALTPDFRPDIDALEKAVTPRTRVLIINSPNNPTGCIYPEEDLRRIAKIVDDENERREKEGGRPLFLLSDEPYRIFAFDGAKVPPILPLTKWSLVIGSFSKSISLAGERVGYLLANPAMPDVQTLLAALVLTTRTLGSVNAPVIGQRLAAELLDETVDLSIYDSRRKLMAKVLSNAGIEFPMPAGAFYFFAKSPVADEMKFVDALLEEKILVVTGKGFGYPGYIRLSCSVDEQIIARAEPGFKRAMERLSK